ncbi:SAM-dependent methyltransferase [Actinomadura barringtoniae]|uniref:SAM-dependent methyltransferase n=1 Tax=Actinomadura barringtoniae TaxID=1427535 RepID=A0A939PLQ5_9ACTN|nr:SAM-dependent methyltransferase [Actinomadura barringtoniae]MBO2454393.1 SAM-dependent methyltransferase [Actinomadura barringtoniae]
MEAEWAPQGIDVTKPSVARVYDAALGGKDNFEVDRVVLAQLAEGTPGVAEMAKINRRTLGRAVRVMAGELGVRQFLDLGAGLPSAENTHQVAQSIAPESRVVYVDKDPIVLAHGRALLAEDDRTAVITADLREPESVLKQQQVTRLIDFEQPVGVMLVAILHHLHDDEDPKGLLDAYMDAVPPGSPVFITHFCSFSPVAEALQEKFLRLLGTGRFRSPEEITAYFDGYELLEPGVVPNPHWRPDGRAPGMLTVAEQLHYTGMAIKK